MKVVLGTSYVGDGVEAHEGDTVDLPAEIAERLIERGSAEKVAGSTQASRRERATGGRREKRG